MPYKTTLRLTETPCAVFVAREKVNHLIRAIKEAGGTISKQYRYADIIKGNTKLNIAQAQELVNSNYQDLFENPTPYCILCDVVPRDVIALHHEICQDTTLKSSATVSIVSIGGDF